MSGFRTIPHLLLLIFTSVIVGASSCDITVADGWELRPLMEMEPVFASERQRDDISEICALCTCCESGSCAPHPCCYAIDCNNPSRPGSCSFIPKRCTCRGCNIKGPDPS